MNSKLVLGTTRCLWITKTIQKAQLCPNTHGKGKRSVNHCHQMIYLKTYTCMHMSGAKTFNLCLNSKKEFLLNRRTEILSKCRHLFIIIVIHLYWASFVHYCRSGHYTALFHKLRSMASLGLRLHDLISSSTNSDQLWVWVCRVFHWLVDNTTETGNKCQLHGPLGS